MRFMMIVKANKDSEAGKMPSEEQLLEMGKYNEQLVNAGILLDATGLESSAKGYRVEFSPNSQKVVKGPFANTSELIAGYWVLKVGSPEEAIEWAKRVPFREGAVELRRLFEMEDFTPGEGVEQAKELGKRLEQQKAAA